MHARASHVVIVGGGFGGLSAARHLDGSGLDVTVVDRHNYHLFQPLLYQVATASLSPNNIAYPIRSTLRRQPNCKVVLAAVEAINPETRTVALCDATFFYDYLILAAGSRDSYFGHPEWETVAPGLKSVEDALEIRRRILLAFERAEREPDPGRRRALLTFVIVGGGPTGVELAGAVAEIACQVMIRDFRQIDPRAARIILVEAGPRVLSSFPTELSAKAQASLGKLGVDVRTNAPVTSISTGLVVAGVQPIRCETVVWAAGVRASPLARTLGVPLDSMGRVLVDPDLSVPGHPEVFVIGDLAAFVHQGGEPLPGLAPVAVQQGRHAARNVLRRHQGLPTQPFHYAGRGALATIGRAAAVAHFGPVKISGWIAWVAWALIHIVFLIGFRNKFVVLFDWAWAYITLQRSARLILGRTNDGPEWNRTGWTR